MSAFRVRLAGSSACERRIAFFVSLLRRAENCSQIVHEDRVGPAKSCDVADEQRTFTPVA